MNKTQIIIGAVGIIAILLISGFYSGIIKLQSANDYGTGQVISTKTVNLDAPGEYSTAGVKWLTATNSLNHNAPGELFDSDRYVVSWQPNGRSVTAIASCDMQFFRRWDFLEIYIIPTPFKVPDAIFKDYYWDVDYTDVTGKTIKVIDGLNFTGGPDDTSVLKDYVYLRSSSYPKNTFANLQHYSDITDPPETPSNYNYAKANPWDVYKWWCYNGDGYVTLPTGQFSFDMVGNRVGVLDIKCYVRTALREDIHPFPGTTSDLHWHERDYLMSEDWCYLAPGRGEVRIDSVNSISNKGTAIAPETGAVYTKLVYEEGSTVTFSVDTGYSGNSLTAEQKAEGFTGGWNLQIVNSKGLTVKNIPLADGLKNYKVPYVIPTGSFIKGGDNEWMVVLSNTLFDQSETRIFVVDSYKKIPGQTVVVPNKNQYNQWETATITMSAKPNTNGTNDINHFRVWATYDFETSTNYALTARNVPATKSGDKYTGSVNFQVVQGGKNVYFTALAIDSDGRAGPEGMTTVWVVQVIPNPGGGGGGGGGGGLLPGGDITLIIIVVAIIAVVVGIYLYVLYSQRKIGGNRR